MNKLVYIYVPNGFVIGYLLLTLLIKRPAVAMVNKTVGMQSSRGIAPVPVYSSQSIVGWTTHVLVRKWEMLAPSISQIVFVVFHSTPVTSFYM
jgi:hypothetical protein